MINEESWVLLWRKFQKRLERPYSNSSALLWLIFNVTPNGNDIGKISITLNELAYEWGWFRKKRGDIQPDIQKVKKFLQEMDEEKTLSATFGQPCLHLSKPRSIFAHVTLLKYAFFQRKDTGPNLVVDASVVMPFSMSRPIVPEVAKKTTSCNPLKNKEKRINNKEVHTEKNKNKRGSARGRKTPPSQPPPPSKNVEEIQEALEKIDLDEFQKSYPTLDVPKFFTEEFSYKMINGTSKIDEPNPYNNVNFKLAFRTWCKNAVKNGEYLKEVSTRRVWVEGPMILGD